MKVFITGGSGWIGRHVVPLLISQDHEVLALSRSEEADITLKSIGATPVRGGLIDLEVIRSSAKGCDAAIHLAFIHDRASPNHDMARNLSMDKDCIMAIAEGLGPEKILINSSGMMGAQERTAGAILTEDHTTQPRLRHDHVESLRKAGLKAFAVRLAPTIHGDGDRGFMSVLEKMAAKAGFMAYIGDGSTKWCACHVSDAAQIFALILEKEKTLPAERLYFHAAAEEGILLKDIAMAIGQRLDLPVKTLTFAEATALLGVMARLISVDAWASNEITKRELGWTPVGPLLLEDLVDAPSYGRDSL